MRPSGFTRHVSGSSRAKTSSASSKTSAGRSQDLDPAPSSGRLRKEEMRLRARPFDSQSKGKTHWCRAERRSQPPSTQTVTAYVLPQSNVKRRVCHRQRKCKGGTVSPARGESSENLARSAFSSGIGQHARVFRFGRCFRVQKWETGGQQGRMTVRQAGSQAQFPRKISSGQRPKLKELRWISADSANGAPA